MKKEVAIIGVGKMGGNLALRLKKKKWKVLGLHRGDDFSKIKNLPRPRVILLSVPSNSVDSVLKVIDKYLRPNDIIIDGGNSFFKDTIQRAKDYSKKGIKFVDVGISGGPSGAKNGASLMIGGRGADYKYLIPLFKDLSVSNGFEFFEGVGAGHFVKMVHNGIEYGMMQSLAEGFFILKKSKYKLDLRRVANIYQHGSVIESRLVGWLASALEIYGEDFKGISGSVGHTGEGEWTVKTAKQLGINAKVLEEAFKFRIGSQKRPSWSGKLLQALRGQFGGHKTGK